MVVSRLKVNRLKLAGRDETLIASLCVLTFSQKGKRIKELAFDIGNDE